MDLSKQDRLVANLVALDSGLVLHGEEKLVEYDAISYTWGSGALTSRIICNGVEWSITGILEDALKRLRYETTSRYLWADQVCINQSDDAEKATQVQHMFTVFNRAQKVVAWPGEAGHFTNLLLRYVNDPEHFYVPEHVLQAGLRDLCPRSWSRRVWVQQEVFAARETVILCGPYNFTLDLYHDAASRLSHRVAHHHAEHDHSELAIAVLTIERLRTADPETITHLQCEKLLVLSGNQTISMQRRWSNSDSHHDLFCTVVCVQMGRTLLKDSVNSCATTHATICLRSLP